MPTSYGNTGALGVLRAKITGAVMERLLEQVDFSRLASDHLEDVRRLCQEQLKEEITSAVERQLGGPAGVEALATQVATDLVTTSAFLALLQREEISDILVNGPGQVWIEAGGQLRPTQIVFPPDGTLERTALWMTARVGRPVTPDQPMVDVRLPDGSRLKRARKSVSPHWICVQRSRAEARGMIMWL